MPEDEQENAGQRHRRKSENLATVAEQSASALNSEEKENSRPGGQRSFVRETSAQQITYPDSASRAETEWDLIKDRNAR